MAGEIGRQIDDIPVVADASARESRFPISSRRQDQRVFRKDTKNVERWVGAEWQVDLRSAESVLVAVEIAEEAREESVASASVATIQATRAESEANRAEVASDAATVNAAVFGTPELGLAGTAEGDQFQVPGDTEIVRYQHDPGPIATPVATYPSSAAVAAVSDRVGLNPGPDALDAYAGADGLVYRYTKSDGSLMLPGLEGAVQDEIIALKDSAFAKTARVFDAYPVPSTLPDVIGVELYGQSNATGANSQPALTTTKPSGIPAITFNDGPKSIPTESATSMISLIDLIEDNESGDSDIHPGPSTRGETQCSTTAYNIWAHYLKEHGPDVADAIELFAHTAAVGGQSIGPLSTTHYPRFTTSIEKAFELVDAASKLYAVGAIVYDGNEANQGNATVIAYRSAIRTLYNTMVADIRNITGQDFDPIWMMAQKSWSMQTGTYPASVTLAQLAEQGAGMFVSHPDYCTFIIATTDTIHRKAIGNILSGYFYARCFRNVMIRGQNWRGLTLKAAWWENGKGYVKFDVPVQPIVLDSDTLGAATQHGFKLIDDSGSLPVEVRVVSGDTVEFTPSRSRDGAVTLRVGMDYLPAKCTLVAGSGGTTLRDSDTETVKIDGNDYLLANWALSATLPFAILE